MYTNDKNFIFRDLIIKIIFLGIFALLLIWLFPKVPNMKPFYSNIFRENISYMQGAAKSYFTTDKLPTELYASSKLTLSEMEEKNLIIPFVDKDGNSCNAYESYAEVTKEANGYKLKIQLTCNAESDFIVEILGCYDYGCDKECSTSTETAIEYQFTKNFSKKITTTSCAKGYTKDGNYCYKTTGYDKTPAKANYKDGYDTYFTILYKPGESVKTPLTLECKDTTTKDKKYAANIPTPVIGEDCKYKEVKDPNCSVQGKWKIVDGEYVLVYNICGTIKIKECSDIETGTTYSCPDGYTDEGPRDKNLKCYKEITTTTKSCECPKDATEETGSGENKKCYKYVEGPKTPYCENKNAVIDNKLNKCVLQVGSEFSHYSCINKDYKLDKDTKMCIKTNIDKVKVTTNTYTKKWTQTKWSRSKTLYGWTPTEKTRIVEVK